MKYDNEQSTHAESVFIASTRSKSPGPNNSNLSNEAPNIQKHVKFRSGSIPQNRAYVSIPTVPKNVPRPKSPPPPSEKDSSDKQEEDNLEDEEVVTKIWETYNKEPVVSETAEKSSDNIEEANKKRVRRISKIQEELEANPQYAEYWKYFLPMPWLATSPLMQKSLLDALRTRNIKVNSQAVGSEDHPVLSQYSLGTGDSEEEDGVVINDPVVQFYNLTDYRGPYNLPHSNIAPESTKLRTLWPKVGESGVRRECLLDSGSQIASMSRKVAMEVGLYFNPNDRILMESANNTRTWTCGIARNVPFNFGGITYYLQVHILENPSYKILLGLPFEEVSKIAFELTDGSVMAILSDPTTGQKLVVPAYKRGELPPQLKKSQNHQVFQRSSVKSQSERKFSS